MWKGRLAQNLREIAVEALALCGGRYPAFVYGGDLRPGTIPVFCYHGVDEGFEATLAFLRDNDYRTLGTDDYYEILIGQRPAPARAVLLTSDDGDPSIWTIAVPLLKRYDMRMTLFVIPGRTPDLALVRPTLEDVWKGRMTREQFDALQQGTPGILTWDEVRAAHASGVIDVQSHSLTHGVVFTEPRVVEFMHPGLVDVLHPHEYPLLEDDLPEGLQRPPAFGTPLYRTAPTLAATRRYLSPKGVRRACAEFVAREGGTEFFARPRWRRELRDVEQTARRWAGAPQYESCDARLAAMRRELAESKRRLEQEVPGLRVRHFCYPWGYGLPAIPELAREAGYVTGFWLDAHRCWPRVARVGHDPLRIPRLGTTWVRSLPGRNRALFAERLWHKVRRRIRTGSAYLTHS